MNKYKLMFALSVIAWAVCIVYLLTVPVHSEDFNEPVPSHEDLVFESIVIAADVNKPAEEPITYEDWFRNNANRISNCEITHYCAEKYEHICGTGDGITASGVPITANWTCAVVPRVIPYGAEVMVDYGDRVEFWKAQDCGSAINGNHIDLAVETHAEAMRMGIMTADVYWLEVDHEFG